MKTSGLRSMIANRRNRAQVYSTAEYWDAKADDFEGDAVSMWPNNHLNRHYHDEQTRYLEAATGNVQGKTVLDVGCGTGRISRFLTERGGRVTGIDFAAKAIEVARSTTAGDNPSYRVESVFEFDEVERYDLIASWGSLVIACTTEAELEDVLARLLSALVPGGQLVILEPIHGTFLHRVLKMGIDDFQRVLERVGFEVEEVRPLHFWPVRLALAYIPWPGWITTPGFRVGQALMKLLGNHPTLGDYKAVKAVKPLSTGL